jgi:uncharacterized protein YjiS (DUF1127 family)
MTIWNEQYHMHHEKEYAMPVIASRRQSSPRRPRSILSTVLDVLSLCRQRRRLAELDPHLLRDIGITEGEARREAELPVWDVPSHWRR